MANNGEALAFPTTNVETDLHRDRDTGEHYPHTYTYEGDGGLTKRELFAAMAMQGLCANPDQQTCNSGARVRAVWAVEQADALLEQLAVPHAG